MKNQVLNEIKKFAIQKLNETYGYCGCADSEEFTLLNSDDRDGKSILITLELKKEE